jgi:hypothetical protein
MQALCPADHVYKVAVYPDAVELDSYTPEGEWSGYGYEAGGAVLSGYRITVEDGDAVLRFNTVEWLDADIKARTILIYDATTGYALNLTQLERVVGVYGGLFEYRMPDEGVARIG